MIRYHGTPFSGDATTRLALSGRHAMVSFARPDDLEVVAELCQSFVLDNGAFSAWRRGEEIDLAKFFDWAETWLRHPGCDFAIAPDVIDGDEDANDRLLRNIARSASWVPVWHLHESLDRLVRLAHEWRRIALGSSGAFATPNTPRWWARMTEALEQITSDDGMPICKLHGLRMLDPVIFSHIPFSSADSCNVARNIGLVDRWTGRYMPRTAQARALVLIDRIEAHAAAHRWNPYASGVAQNFDLFG